MVIAFFYGTVVLWSVNIPYSDDYWAFFDFPLSFLRSNEKWTLLFSQHNEHRPVFERIITLLYLSLSNGINIKSLIFIGNLSLLGMFHLFIQILTGENAPQTSSSNPPSPVILTLQKKANTPALQLVPVALLLFSYSYWETIYWGMGALCNLWVVYFSLLSLYFLTRNKAFPTALFSSAATFTTGSGILTLPIGLLSSAIRRRSKLFVVLISTSALAGWLYFRDYTKPTYHPSVKAAFLHPFQPIVFSLSLLGSAVSLPFDGTIPEPFMFCLSTLAGTALAAFFVFLTVRKYYQNHSANYHFMCFLIANSLLVGLTRSGFGMGNSLTSRYAIHSVVFLICVYLSLLDLGIFRTKKTIGLIIIFCLLLNYSSFKIASLRQNDRIRNLVCNMLLFQNHITSLRSQDVDLSFPAERGIPFLEEAKQKKIYNVSTALQGENLDTYVSAPQNFFIPDLKAGKGFYSLNQVDPGKNLLKIGGWSFMTPADGANVEKYIVLISKKDKYIFNTFTVHRPDVSRHYHGDLDDSGFYGLILNRDIKKGTYDLWLYLKGKGSDLCQDTHTELKLGE